MASHPERVRELLGVLRGDPSAFIEALRVLTPDGCAAMLRDVGARAPTNLSFDDRCFERDSFALTVAGALWHGRAFQHRGFGGAEDVRESSWTPYAQSLAAALDRLHEALSLDPGNGQAAAWLVAASLESEEDAKRIAEDRLAASVSPPLFGFLRLLTLWTEKWGGSHAAMWRVAGNYSSWRPPGSLALVAKAHYEQWLWYSNFDEEVGAQGRAYGYFRQLDVATSLKEASRGVLAAPLGDRYMELLAHNHFAAVFDIAGMSDHARPHLRALGRDMDGSIWLHERPGALGLGAARLRAGLFPLA